MNQQQPPQVELPTSFKLLKQVQNWMKLRRSGPRSRGFHPSEIPKLCPVKFRIYEKAMDDFAHPDNEVRARAVATVTKILNTEHDRKAPNRLPSHIVMDCEIGTQIHDMVQFHLGVQHRLLGAWECRKCYFKVDGMMPRSTEPGVDGSPVFTAAPCPKCRGQNMRHDWPWKYIEPHISVPEWDVEGHTDGILVINYKGVDFRAILEIKSINEAGYKEAYGPPLPKPEHVEQASTYAWAHGLTHIYFIYVNKNALRQWKEFLVPINMAAVEHAKRTMKICLESRRDGKLPIHARSCASIEHRDAAKCPVVEECFGRKPPVNFFAGDSF